MLLDVVVHAEVDEGEPVGAAAPDLVDRLLPGGEIELRGRTRRHDERTSSDTHSGRVAGVERALGVEIRDVVPCVPGRRETLEPHDDVADDVDILRRHRRQLAPESVEGIAVEPASACLELRRIDDVRRAHLGDVHLQRRVLPDEHTRGSRMVEVDVR